MRLRWLLKRRTKTKGYKLKKTLHCLMGNVLANTWDASWQDAQTGKPMLGRGTEIWIVRDGRIAMWDATFNVWEKGGPPSTPVKSRARGGGQPEIGAQLRLGRPATAKYPADRKRLTRTARPADTSR